MGLDESVDGPRNLRQVYNAKARLQKEEKANFNQHKANFADQVSALKELQDSLPFVKLIIRQNRKVPCVIL